MTNIPAFESVLSHFRQCPVIKGLLLQALITFVAFFPLWLPAFSLPRIPTAWATRLIGKAYRRVRARAIKVWTEPGGHVRVLIWVIAAVLVVAVFVIPGLDNYQPEAVSVAFTVIVLNELIRYQNRLEYRQSILRQLASQSNDFALDAARICVNERWHVDGSLREASLEGANLRGAHLRYFYLEQADLLYANLERADLIYANLEGATLLCAYLRGATLSHAHLRGATLGHANLEGVDLSSSDLAGADLLGTNLEGARGLNTARFDHFTIYGFTTKWPAGFTPPDIATNYDSYNLHDEPSEELEQEMFMDAWEKNRERILCEARGR